MPARVCLAHEAIGDAVGVGAPGDTVVDGVGGTPTGHTSDQEHGQHTPRAPGAQAHADASEAGV
jgi:hypothetical protein